MKKVAILVILCVIVKSVHGQIEISKEIARSEFYTYHFVKNEREIPAINAFINRKVDSLERSNIFDNAINGYEEKAGLYLDDLVKRQVKSETSGFLIYLLFNKRQIDSIRREPVDEVILTRVTMQGIENYLGQMPSNEMRSVESYYADVLKLGGSFYGYLSRTNRGREFANVSPIWKERVGSPEYWASTVLSDTKRRYGYLKITSNVNACSIQIDERVHKRPTDVDLVVPIPPNEEVTIRVSKEEYESYIEKVKLINGDWARVEAKMKKKK